MTVAWAPGTHHSIVEGEGARAVAAIVERHSTPGAGRKGRAVGTAPHAASNVEPSALQERIEGMETR